MRCAVDGSSSTESWTTPVVRRLLWANGIIFLARLATSTLLPWNALVLSPSAVFERGAVWQLFTYMYLHFDLFHLLSNLFGLYVFGPDVERVFGARRFFSYYTACGFGGAIAACLFYPNSVILGASGAFYGVLFAFAALFPYRPVLIFFLAPIEARWLAILYGAIDLIGGIQGGTGYAHFAHLGGLFTGLAIFVLNGQIRITRSSSPARPAKPSVIAKWTTAIKQKAAQKKQERRRISQAELDAILDKISKSGMNSLTREERARLKNASAEMRKIQS